MRVEFRLTMPGVASWNGRWSGEGRNYLIFKKINKKQAEVIGIEEGEQSWYHQWPDGWCAKVTARVMKPGERRAKSEGFWGYDWMVENILMYNSTRNPDEDKK